MMIHYNCPHAARHNYSFLVLKIDLVCMKWDVLLHCHFFSILGSIQAHVHIDTWILMIKCQVSIRNVGKMNAQNIIFQFSYIINMYHPYT